MFPILIHLGPFILPTANLILVIAIIATGFAFWKRSHAEHYEDDQVFDVMIIATLLAVLGARIGAMVFMLEHITFSSEGMLKIVTDSGFQEMVGVIVGFVVLYKLAKQRKWDAYELTDFAAVAVSLFFVIHWVGRFFAGSYLGTPAQVGFLGMHFPQVFEPVYPVQLFFCLAFFILHFILMFFEKRYRFFQWYRGARQTAYSGFPTGLFVFGYGLIWLTLGWFTVEKMSILGFNITPIVAFVFMIVGIGIIYWRSGLNKWHHKKRLRLFDKLSA